MEVLTRADHHEIRITGMDRVWGLRANVTVPFSQLDEVRVMPVGEATRGVWLRTGGLAWPRRPGSATSEGARGSVSTGGGGAHHVWS
ncbi:MAG: hypothetical protein R2878_03205 [Thermoleophilia bacterium]